MSDRRNRRTLAVIGLLLAAAGCLSACLGAGVFGTARSDHAVFNSTIVQWWNEGGWESFAVIVAIGAVAVAIGAWMVLPQLRRTDSRSRTPTIVFAAPEIGHGETTLHAPALSHGLESDLTRIPDVKNARAGLFGAYPDIELRAVIEVGDDADLQTLPGRVEEVFARIHATTGVHLDPIQITLRFKDATRERQLHQPLGQ